MQTIFASPGRRSLPSLFSRIGRGLSALAFGACVVACSASDADDDGRSPDATGTGSGGTGGGWVAGGAGNGSGPAENGGAGGGPVTSPVQSWDIVSDVEINGHTLQDEIQSAVALHSVHEGQDYLAVLVTDVPSYCSALIAGDCGPEVHFHFELDLTGLEPGKYQIGGGEADAWMGDVPESCVGAGIGADGGWIEFQVIDTSASGVVEVSFDVSFFGGHVEGSVVAPLCEAD